MVRPHIHVPYDKIAQYLPFIREGRFDLEIYFPTGTIDTLKGNDLVQLKRSLDYGPSLSIHAPFMDLSPGAVDPKVRAVTIERFLLMFDVAELLEPRAIVFHSGYEKWRYALDVRLWLEKSVKTWRAFVRKAEDRNIKIAIENVFEDAPDNLRLLMEEMSSPHFGVCFDTGHCHLFSRVALEEWIGQLLPYICELHLHDNRREADDHLAIGDGTFEFERLFSLLSGRDLIYTIEGRSPEDVAKSIERLNRYL